MNKRVPIKFASKLAQEPVQEAPQGAAAVPETEDTTGMQKAPEEASSRLTVDLPARLHATMKVSCKKRKIPMAREVVQLLEWHYRSGPAVEPPAEAAEEIRRATQERAILGTSIEPKENGKGKMTEPMVRTAFSIPPTLHEVISVGAAGRRTKIAEEIRDLLSRHYLGAGSVE